MKTILIILFVLLTVGCYAQDTVTSVTGRTIHKRVVGMKVYGKYDGVVTTYHSYENDSNYKLYAKGYFSNGHHIGPDSVFDDDGNIWKVYQFTKEGTHFKSYHSNGKISSIGHWKGKDDNKFGQWISFYDNGQIESIENFSNGKEDGYAIRFFPNGQLQLSGKHSKGLRTGSWTEGDSLGKSISVGKYKAIALSRSELDSIPLLPDSVGFQVYAPCQVMWKDFGVKDGVWTILDTSNGAVIDRRKYVNGRLEK